MNNEIFYFITGSSLFCTNCKDTDVISIRHSKERLAIREDGRDTFLFTLDEFRNRLYFNEKINLQYRELYNVGFAMVKQKGEIYGDIPDDIANYNWFDYKDKIIERCIDQCVNIALNPRIVNSHGKDLCLKHTYWLFANYFALANNSLEFTDEQKEILQKCHDNELPRTYADELYQNLIEMKNNL